MYTMYIECTVPLLPTSDKNFDFIRQNADFTVSQSTTCYTTESEPQRKVWAAKAVKIQLWLTNQSSREINQPVHTSNQPTGTIN